MTEKDETKEEKKDDKKEEKPKPVDQLVESKHSVTINGKELKYTVLSISKDPGQVLVWLGALLLFGGFTLLQRRSGLFVCVAAPGAARPAPRGPAG